MVKNIITLLVVVGVVGGVTLFNSKYEPSRIKKEKMEEQMAAAKELEAAMAEEEKVALEKAIEEVRAKNAEDTIVIAKADTEAATVDAALETPPVETPAEAPKLEVIKDWPASAPDTYKLLFECSTGDFVVECHKAWAPLGADRFYQLNKEGYYNGCRFFRVLPGFMVQFGINGDPKISAPWKNANLKDDPLVEGNKTGYITFANSGPNSRSTQVFINYANNHNLDKYQGYGFPAFGKVILGFENVQAINPEYKERPNQGLIHTRGNAYLNEAFPKLDFIKKVSLIK